MSDERKQPRYFAPEENPSRGILKSDREKLIIDANAKESGGVVGRFLDEETRLPKEVQVPRLPFTKFIDPAGNVVSMPVRNNRVYRSTENPYESWIKAKKAKRGWVEYDSLDATEREELIRKRKDLHNRSSSAFAVAFRSQEDRLIEGNKEALKAVMAELVTAVKAAGGPVPEPATKTAAKRNPVE